MCTVCTIEHEASVEFSTSLSGSMLPSPQFSSCPRFFYIIDLISPEDLYRSCSLFSSLQLPLTLRKFASGVEVLQSPSHTDRHVAQLLQDYFTARQSVVSSAGPSVMISAQEWAQHRNISLVLAREQLLSAETLGQLCRDETVEGLFFAPNLFVVGFPCA